MLSFQYLQTQKSCHLIQNTDHFAFLLSPLINLARNLSILFILLKIQLFAALFFLIFFYLVYFCSNHSYFISSAYSGLILLFFFQFLKLDIYITDLKSSFFVSSFFHFSVDIQCTDNLDFPPNTTLAASQLILIYCLHFYSIQSTF